MLFAFHKIPQKIELIVVLQIRADGISESVVERCLLMVQWVIGSILHGGPMSYISFQPVLHNSCNKGCGMCYPVCGMMHIKEPLLLIGKNSPCFLFYRFQLKKKKECSHRLNTYCKYGICLFKHLL